LSSRGLDTVLDFERLWAGFIDDLLPVVGPGASAVIAGDWSELSKESVADVLQVWKVWTRYRTDLGTAAKRLVPFSKGSRNVDPRVARVAQSQLAGYNAFRQAIAPTEEREKRGLFGRFQGWLSDKTTDLKESLRDFDLDEWTDTGAGQAVTAAAGIGLVAATSYKGDVDGYMDRRELPDRERFRDWGAIEEKYPGATRLSNPAPKGVSKLGYGTVVGQVPDGRVIYQTTVSMWVVAAQEL
jgi:hypothetical protein